MGVKCGVMRKMVLITDEQTLDQAIDLALPYMGIEFETKQGKSGKKKLTTKGKKEREELKEEIKWFLYQKMNERRGNIGSAMKKLPGIWQKLLKEFGLQDFDGWDYKTCDNIPTSHELWLCVSNQLDLTLKEGETFERGDGAGAKIVAKANNPRHWVLFFYYWNFHLKTVSTNKAWANYKTRQTKTISEARCRLGKSMHHHHFLGIST